MFFQPVLPLVIVSVILLAFLVFKLVKATTKQARLTWTLRAVTILLLAVVALRPSVPTLDNSEIYNSRYDVYFVVDLTSSVVAEDWGDQQARLDGVRADINDLLDDYVGAKFALITFNSTASLRVPLTPDATALASAANTMLPEVTQYSQGSSSELVAETLTNVLHSADENASADEKRAKVVYYFSDGEETSQNSNPGDFSEVGPLVTASKVYGYGTEQGGQMKEQNGYYIVSAEPTYITDGSGNPGISVIDQANLQRIATEMGGDYEHRSADNRITPAEISNEMMLDLQKAEESSIQNTYELYWVFLIPVALLMFVQAGLIFRNASRLGVIVNGS